MSLHNHLSPEELYRQGLQHFNRAEWERAIAIFTELESIDNQYKDVDDLLADARLKLHFEGSGQPIALAPPQRPAFLPLLAALALLFVAASAYGLYYLNASTPNVVEAAPPFPTSAPPTARPTQVPTALPTPQPTAAPILPATVVVTAADSATFINTPANIEIIVDASGSMLAKIAGSDKQRWQVAQDALNMLVDSGSISKQSLVVVRTYGRRRGNDCNDLEVAQGLSRFNPESLKGVIAGLKPAVGGMTPLAASLRAANEDLQAAEGSTVVILVTDGLESCNGDPIAEANNFVTGTDQRKIHVIGFTIDEQEARDKLRQIADKGKGLYFDAGNSAQLAEALRQTIVLSYQVFAPDGEQVTSGTVGGAPIQLKPGTYKLKINANPAIEKELKIENGGNVVVSLRQGFGGLLADIKGK